MKRGDVVCVFSLARSEFPVYALDDIHNSTVAHYLKNDDQGSVTRMTINDLIPVEASY